jgi:hypothetical protein
LPANSGGLPRKVPVSLIVIGTRPMQRFRILCGEHWRRVLDLDVNAEP